MLPPEFLSRAKAALGEANLLTDPADCYAYACDNSRKAFPPEAVAFASETFQVQQILKLCNEYRVPLTPRGRGTGTAGGSVPERGGVVLSLERMRRILSLDPANRVIVVEPGVLNQEVQDAAKPHGFFWPPDPSSSAYCSVGGNLATSAGGPHAVKYGTTREHVLGLKAVTGNGELIKTGCYTSKGVVGYDLTRLLIGSEGTLAVITEATLKLTPLPQTSGGIIAYYRNITSCAQAVVSIMAQPHIPSALEFLDHGSLQLLRDRNPGMLPPEAGAMLMIEMDGSNAEIAEAGGAVLHACHNQGLINAALVDDAATLWAARKALSPLLRDIAPKKINEDVVVPVSRLPEFLQDLGDLSRKHGVININFGHAGNGNIHVNLLVNPDNEDEMRRAQDCLAEIFRLVLKLNGTISGEHGIGREKRVFIEWEIDAATLNLMKAIKQVFDPGDILNPGKLFP